MKRQRRYRKREDQIVSAVRIDLKFGGFDYKKWGGVQTCNPGDWLVDNRGDIYTIAADSFEETYERVSPGRYRKMGMVWAEVASEAGVIKTKEGSTAYRSGDYIVCNNEDGTDAYAVGKTRFEAMYEPVNSQAPRTSR